VTANKCLCETVENAEWPFICSGLTEKQTKETVYRLN